MTSLFSRATRVVAAVALVLAACAPPSASASSASATPAPAPAPAAPRGHLLIVGGGPRPEPLARRFIDLAGGPGKARIVVFPMASGVASTGEESAAALRELGADAFYLRLTREEATSDSVVRLLDGVTGVWFPGGDQSRLTAAIGGTPIEAAIHRLYQQGAVVGGTSAGAAVMSAIMITGDERRPGGARPDSSLNFGTIDRENIVTSRGFGLLPDAIVDQHFLRRRRHNRLMSLALEHPTLVSVGIDESTAIQVNPGGCWDVLGAGQIVIYDPRQAQLTGSASPLGAAGVKLSVLPAGSRYEPETGEAELGTGEMVTGLKDC